RSDAMRPVAVRVVLGTLARKQLLRHGTTDEVLMLVIETRVEDGDFDPGPGQSARRYLGGLQTPGEAGLVEAWSTAAADDLNARVLTDQAIDQFIDRVAIATQIVWVEIGRRRGCRHERRLLSGDAAQRAVSAFRAYPGHDLLLDGFLDHR